MSAVRAILLHVFAVALAMGVWATDVLVVCERSGVDRWRVEDGKWTRVGAFADTKGLKPVAVAAANDTVFIACEKSEKSGSIEKFSPAGRPLGTLAQLQFRPHAMAAAPDGKSLCLTSRSRRIHRVSLMTGEVSILMQGVPTYTTGIQFGPGGILYLSSSYYSAIAVYDVAETLSSGKPADKLGTIQAFDCQTGFSFGGANLDKLIVPGTWIDSIDLVRGETDVRYPEQAQFAKCLSTVRVGGEVYAADFAGGRIVHVPAVPGPVETVASGTGSVSSMVNLTETLNGTESARFVAAGRKLFAGEPMLTGGMTDFERMKFNNPGLVVDLSGGIWPILSICADDALEIGTTSVPRSCRLRYAKRAPYVYSAGKEVTDKSAFRRKYSIAVPCGAPSAGPQKGARASFNDFFVDMNGDGVRDCVRLYTDWTAYGEAGPRCKIVYDDKGRWATGQIQFDAYVFLREGTEKKGTWSAPQRLLPDAFDARWNGPWGAGGAAFADYDGDGDADLVCGDFRSEIWYLENVGTKTEPTFALPRRARDTKGAELEGDLCMMTLQGDDYDGDGKTDLLAAEEDGRISVFRNTGTLTADRTPVFEPQRFCRQEADELKFGCLSTPFAVDWDGDGDQDLICGNSAGYIAFIENLSGEGVEHPKWAEPKLLTVKDPENAKVEGWLKGIVIQSRCGESNSPQGPAEAKWGYSVCTVADWDGDGFLDVMANDVKGSVVWFRNPGQKGTTILEAPQAVEVEWDGAQPVQPWDWREHPGKALRAPWRTTPLMVDWNKDGLVDLLLLDTEHHLSIYERAKTSDGKLVLKPPRTLLHNLAGKPISVHGDRGGSGRRKLCVADWDGDGRLDILMSGGNVFAYLNRGEKDGKTVFEETRKLARKALSGHTNCPTAVDFNADGVPDIVTGGEDGNFYYLRNPRSSRTNGAFVIAERGRLPGCHLVVTAPWETATHAAEELQSYVRRLTGVELPVSKDGTGPRIVLAAGAEDLGDDGFRIVQKGGELRIEGGRRGVLYGAYDVLQTFGGVEWYSSWCEEVPTRDRLEVPSGFVRTAKPAIPARDVFWKDVLDHPDFWSRLRLNCRAFRSPAPEKFGGDAFRQSRGLSGHSFDKLVPPEKHFKTHPEYFSEVAGKRLRERTQLCLTNPEVLALVIKGVEQQIAREPSARIFAVAQNDWLNFCTCPACRALDEAEGSHAGTMITFVNAVADAIAKSHPDVFIHTFAYQYTRKPPKHVRPRKNVLISLCPIECDYGKSLCASRYKENVAFREDIRDWSKLTDRLMVWDYTTDFEHFLVPFPNVKSLQDNVRFFRDTGVWRVMEQGAYRGCHGEFAELKAYLLAKWLWDPEAPLEPLLDRFLTGYYGKAAPYVRRYFESMYAFQVDETKDPLKVFDFIGSHPVSSSPEFLEKSEKLWRAAEKAVADDPVRLYNVKMSAMPVDYVLYNRFFKRVNLSDAADDGRWRGPAMRLAARMREAEAAGRPVRICENNTRDPKLRQAIFDAADGKSQTVGDGQRAWQEESSFKRMGPKGATAIVEDPHASGGKALKLANDNSQWYTTYSLDDVSFAPGVKYVLSVRLRADVTGRPGEVVRVGVHDYANRKGVGQRSFSAKDLVAGYADYDILTWEPASNQGLYIAAGAFDAKKQGHSDAHKGVWIDGFTLRRVGASVDWSVRDYGAKGDGVTKDTKALQAAIDAVSAAGGGRLVMPAGTYLSGTLYLKSGVDLHLSEGAILKASPDRDDYCAADAFDLNYASAGDNMSGGHLLVCVRQKNVTLSGRGTIDGSATAFFKMPDGSWPSSKKAVPWRPGQMLYFVLDENVTASGLKLRNSPYWSFLLHGCDNVQIEGLDVETLRETPVYNGDGIDIDCCRHVRVGGCRIRTEDDSITLRCNSERLGAPRDCADVRISDCELSSHCNAVRIGVGTNAVEDVVIERIKVRDTRTGLNVVGTYSRNATVGCHVRKVVFRDWDVVTDRMAIFFYPGPFDPDADLDFTVTDVAFENFKAVEGEPSSLRGIAARPFRGVSLKGADVRQKDGKKTRFVIENVEKEI